jgi:hypothetical protein
MSLVRTSTSARRVLLVSLAGLMLAAGLSACGSSSSTASAGTTASSSSRVQARLNLAKCFRAHGLNVPDPTTGGGAAGGGGGGGGGGGIFRSLNGYSRAQVQAATAACRSYFAKAFPQANLSPAQRALLQQQLVKFAQCMRSHGVNIPDPTFNGTGGFGFRQAFRSVDRNSPAFQTASKACASVRPRFGPGGGGGPGGGPAAAPGA